MMPSSRTITGFSRQLGSVLVAALLSFTAQAQVLTGPVLDANFAKEYEIGGITVSGADHTDANAVKLFTNLQVGEKVMVPGPKITDAIERLWKQRLFADVRIEAAEIRGSVIFLNVIVQENPKLSRFKFNGVTRGDAEKLRDALNLQAGRQLNATLMNDVRMLVKSHYVEKGFLNTKVELRHFPDSLMANGEMLFIDVTKGPRVRIKDVEFTGNNNIKDRRLRRAMKETKRKRWYNIFGTSKFNKEEYEADKDKVIELYNSKGFRNASIVKDTIYQVSPRRIKIGIALDEDRRFYFRNITFTGNTKYKTDTLEDILSIKRGDIYNKALLESRLYMSQTSRDISSLYMDHGYLSFYPDPVELVTEGDSIDLEIRIREGKQYRIRNVIIKGNTKTYDHVIRREIRTRPGDLFDRSDVLRSQRDLATLGYFDPEKLGVNPVQDPRTGLVDLEYTVEEKPSDRLEVSGGYGASRLVLSLGLSFTNFSMRNLFKKDAWSPLPAGDGQTLNLRVQTTGRYFQSYSISFVEPWLGGRKANSLSISGYYNVQTNGKDREDPTRQKLEIIGATLGLGKRLTVPDDYFILRHSISYQRYILNNYTSLFSFSNGTSNVLAYQISLNRNSIDNPFFARQGSSILWSVKATAPYSAFQGNRDFAGLSDQQRYEWPEFHKWKFTTQWFTRLTRQKAGHELVLMARAGFGFIGRYNKALGDSPFERFYLGGSGLSGFSLDGREIIALRGYDDNTLTERLGGRVVGSQFISKYTTELRFPISLNPSATIYMLGFVEAGNTWNSIDRYDPFALYKSAGFGLRLNLPMFGPMGLDYGWRLDDVPSAPSMAKGQFHFSIGIDLGEL
ncbi:MAG: outer membrane protein assembly factor BamA [Flavobacteriales bacterium]